MVADFFMPASFLQKVMFSKNRCEHHEHCRKELRSAIPAPRYAHLGMLEGHVAEWLRSGLQIRGRRFESGRGLHSSKNACDWNSASIGARALTEPLPSARL